MALPPGARLGPYEILSPLGAGGMGEVYRARDTRLDRTVAIKILPETLAADPQFRERFDREARTISQLTHPHICTLYDVGEHLGTAFLVMECLEGETLADRLKKGALPLDDALKVAIQIADALSTAHRNGVIHRDLTPGNVMLTKAGAKLLDFGLAKATGPAIPGAELSMLPTAPPNLTVQGTILGTFQYMAPEQLEGKEADARTDIFAFGAVLYEMLTGKQPFRGASHAGLISSTMLSQPPSVSIAQTLAPAQLDHLIAGCLAKDPEDRWQSARDVKQQLSWIAEAPTSPSSQATKRHSSCEQLAWGLAGLAVVVLIGAIATMLVARRAPAVAQRFDLATLSTSGEAVAVAEGVGTSWEGISFVVSNNGTLIYRQAVSGQTRLAWVNRAGQIQGGGAPGGIYEDMALSPDDKRVAFARHGQTGTDVWLTDLERRITSRFTFRPLLNNEPIWSSNGRQIVFASSRDGGLDLYRRASDASGPDELLLKLNAPPILFPSDWSADGRFLIYYRTDPKTQLDIWTLSIGAARPVPFLHSDFNESQGQFSPDGRWLAYVSDESGGQQVYVQSFPTLGGQRQISREGGTQPRWRRDGKELFYLAPDRKLMAVTVKTGATLEAEAPRALFQTELNVATLRQSYAVSADGQRFLLNTSLEAGSPPMTVVLNWPALLKK